MAIAPTQSLPPGPRLPRFAQTAGFMLAPQHWIDACRRRYGDVVTFSTLFDPCFVMIYDPELVKRVFQGPPDQLRAGEANAPLGAILGRRSVLLLDGAEHLRQRRLMLPAFHGERMLAYEVVMREAADRAIDAWPTGEPFPLLPSMRSLTLEVIMRAVFGVEEAGRREELKAAIRAMIDPIGGRLSVLAMILTGGRMGFEGRMRSFEARRRRVDELIFEEIDRRRASADLERREDVLSMLALAHDEDGAPMSDEELRDQLLTLLVAGHETTATGLAWAFELLLRTPAVLERLQASLRAGESEYLDATIKEVLRLRPVISGVGRKVRDEPFQLGRWSIPPGIELNPSIGAIHRRADRYPDPRAFRPERFLGADAPDTYTWLPFGGGTRRCLGASFATFEMRIVLARALERTTLIAHGRPDRSVRRGVTFVPRRGARVVQPSPPSTPRAPVDLGSHEVPDPSGRQQRQAAV